jgi:adenylate kinase family enzyme
MIPGARLILLGRQGAGKGTQCVRLSRHFVVPHISTGDMLRAAVREGTDLGRMAKKVMDDGGLVGDDIMIGLVRERLSHHDAKGRGYILDGFPRTVFQAQVLDEMTAQQPIDLVLDLDVPRELVLARLARRGTREDFDLFGAEDAASGGREQRPHQFFARTYFRALGRCRATETHRQNATARRAPMFHARKPRRNEWHRCDVIAGPPDGAIPWTDRPIGVQHLSPQLSNSKFE